MYSPMLHQAKCTASEGQSACFKGPLDLTAAYLTFTAGYLAFTCTCMQVMCMDHMHDAHRSSGPMHIHTWSMCMTHAYTCITQVLVHHPPPTHCMTLWAIAWEGLGWAKPIGLTPNHQPRDPQPNKLAFGPLVFTPTPPNPTCHVPSHSSKLGALELGLTLQVRLSSSQTAKPSGLDSLSSLGPKDLSSFSHK